MKKVSKNSTFSFIRGYSTLLVGKRVLLYVIVEVIILIVPKKYPKIGSWPNVAEWCLEGDKFFPKAVTPSIIIFFTPSILLLSSFIAS